MAAPEYVQPMSCTSAGSHLFGTVRSETSVAGRTTARASHLDTASWLHGGTVSEVDGTDFAEDGAGHEEGLPEAEAFRRVAALYEAHNPRKLNNFDSLRETYKGRERANQLYNQARLKYDRTAYLEEVAKAKAVRVRRQLFSAIKRHNKGILSDEEIAVAVENMLAAAPSAESTAAAPLQRGAQQGTPLTPEETVLRRVLLSYRVLDETTSGGSDHAQNTAADSPTAAAAAAAASVAASDGAGLEPAEPLVFLEEERATGRFRGKDVEKLWRRRVRRLKAEGKATTEEEQQDIGRRTMPFGAAVASALSPLADISVTRLSERQQVLTLLQRYNPTSIAKLDAWAVLHRLTYSDLLTAVRQKYEPEAFLDVIKEADKERLSTQTKELSGLEARYSDATRAEERHKRAREKQSPYEYVKTRHGKIQRKYLGPGAVNDYRAEVYVILSTHDNLRLHHLDKLMEEHEGREDTLLRSLRTTYEPEDLVKDDVNMYFRVYCPGKIESGEAAQIMEEHKGQERVLLSALIREYDNVPIPPVTSFADRDGDGGVGGGRSGGGVADDEEEEDEDAIAEAARRKRTEVRNCTAPGCVFKTLPGKEFCDAHVCAMCLRNRKQRGRDECLFCKGDEEGGLGAGKAEMAARRTAQFVSAIQPALDFLLYKVTWDVLRRYSEKWEAYTRLHKEGLLPPPGGGGGGKPPLSISVGGHASASSSAPRMPPSPSRRRGKGSHLQSLIAKLPPGSTAEFVAENLRVNGAAFFAHRAEKGAFARRRTGAETRTAAAAAALAAAVVAAAHLRRQAEERAATEAAAAAEAAERARPPPSILKKTSRVSSSSTQQAAPPPASPREAVPEPVDLPDYRGRIVADSLATSAARRAKHAAFLERDSDGRAGGPHRLVKSVMHCAAARSLLVEVSSVPSRGDACDQPRTTSVVEVPLDARVQLPRLAALADWAGVPHNIRKRPLWKKDPWPKDEGGGRTTAAASPSALRMMSRLSRVTPWEESVYGSQSPPRVAVVLPRKASASRASQEASTMV